VDEANKVQHNHGAELVSLKGSRLQTAFAVLSVGAALAALVTEWAFGSPDLPFPAAHLVHRDVFPRATLDGVAIGSPIADRYTRFGRTPPQDPRLQSRCCVYFRYDPDLVDVPVALVFLADDGSIQQKWLMKNNETPRECDGLWSDVVELTRYYDAGWCCPWPATLWRGR
jgi:hypothetical protein